MKHARILRLTGATAIALPLIATPAHAVPDCPERTICLWTLPNGGGDLHEWTGGYQNLPGPWHDHVGSFRARRNGAFINYSQGSKICRTVRNGDYADNYNNRFGRVMDAIDNNC